MKTTPLLVLAALLGGAIMAYGCGGAPSGGSSNEVNVASKPGPEPKPRPLPEPRPPKPTPGPKDTGDPPPEK